MADTNKTIADVIAWLRRPREGENAYLTLWRDEIADRLDAAHKREIDELRKQVGNAAKLREAMRLVSRVAEQMTRGTITGEAPTRKEVDDWAMRLCDIIGAALAAPPRNCDVGTVKEQSERKIKFCYNQGGCFNCPFGKSPTLTLCALAWAQMPYEEGGDK